MTPQAEEKIIAIQMLPNISRNKRNQTMKRVQLIEYNMRNIAVTKPCIKLGGKTSTQPFSEKLKLRIFLVIMYNVL